MERPLLEPPKWYDYARPFLAPERVEAGVAYWNAHADELARAEERFGVPAEVVVAILGVETFYGRYIGEATGRSTRSRRSRSTTRDARRSFAAS